MKTCAPDNATWTQVTLDDAGHRTDQGILSCPGSIDLYCAVYAVACPPTSWDDAVAAFEASCWSSELFTCGDYNVAELSWACGGDNVLFFYDPRTGALIAAVEQSSNLGQTCLAGPPTLAPLVQCTGASDCNMIDGGVTPPSDGAVAMPE
jgi:hypothetical protein